MHLRSLANGIAQWSPTACSRDKLARESGWAKQKATTSWTGRKKKKTLTLAAMIHASAPPRFDRPTRSEPSQSFLPTLHPFLSHPPHGESDLKGMTDGKLASNPSSQAVRVHFTCNVPDNGTSHFWPLTANRGVQRETGNAIVTNKQRHT